MAEKPAQERSEEATPQRVRKARQEGKVPQAQEAASALMIMMLLLVLTLTASGLYNHFSVAVQKGLSVKPTGLGDQAAFLSALTNSANQSIIVIMPFLLGGAVVSVFASLLSSGWALSPKAIIPKAERISPIQGAKNLVSLKSVVKLVISILKLTVMVAIVYDFLDGKMEACLALRWAAPEGLLLAISRMAFGLMARLAVCLAAIAAIDLFYHKWQYKHDLRMTRQEVKEERKQYDMSPLLKSRIRGIQIEMVRKRMLQEVPNADMVVVNPTHVAVALKYDTASMDAPTVVAKGPDMLCEKIKEIARANGVPIMYRPELARTIYNSVEVGQPIPEILYVAVAEVLAVIYRLSSKRLNASTSANKQ